MAFARMSVSFDFLKGTTIDEAVSEALEFSCRNNCLVDFNFNGIPMSVCQLSGIDLEEAIEFYKKMYNSMLELRKHKEQKDGDVHMTTDKEKQTLDDQVNKLAKAMDLVDEAYKWFLKINWNKFVTEDCMTIKLKIGQLISDINDIRKFKEER